MQITALVHYDWISSYCCWRREMKIDVAMDATSKINPHRSNPPYQTNFPVAKNAGKGTTDPSAFNARHTTATARHAIPNQ
jgi:hypothetical protein